MTEPRQDHAARDRLLCDIETWLPSTDPGSRRQILDLLSQAAATGADPIATLRDALRQWFGTRAPAMLPRSLSPVADVNAVAIPVEPLINLRRPTLWPQRPKRLVDELFSSWLWRCATASHVSPASFAADTRVLPYDDLDRDIAPETVSRLARLSGQTFAHLAAGTLPTIPAVPQDTIDGMVEDLLMTEDTLRLAPRPGGARKRDRPIVTYCPRCLSSDNKPYFRRRWRLAPFVVCLTHRSMLLDRCWNCQSRINILAWGETGPQPSCGSCRVLLSAAPAKRPTAAATLVPRQRNLEAMLAYLVTQIPPEERAFHLRTLSRQFGTDIRQGRAGVIAALKPATADVWFGAPIDPRHKAPLRLLAKYGRQDRRDGPPL
jgi:hypothetical protein